MRCVRSHSLRSSRKTLATTAASGRRTASCGPGFVKPSRWTEHGTSGVSQYCIGGDQIVYHSDEQKYAGVLFLTPDAPPATGTTMVRSRATKGRTVAESMAIGRVASEYAPRIEADMYKGKLLDPTAWEPVDTIGNVYNRLVLWDARMAHHATNYFGSSLQNGRLFQLFFFDAD